MSREAALERVDTFAGAGGPNVWPQVDRNQLVEGLRARIANPNLIDQERTPLCGPSSLVRMLAFDRPVVYANAVIELYTRGRTRINTLEVTPRASLRAMAPRGQMTAVDWIPIASLRDTSSYVFGMDSLWMAPAGITLPHEIAGWMTRAGYQSVSNVTHMVVRPIATVLSIQAIHAGQLVTQGHHVAMLIGANMLYADRQANATTIPDHWVALASPITNTGPTRMDDPVSFSVWTWGHFRRVPADPLRPLTLRQFLSNYYGYVSCHP